MDKAIKDVVNCITESLEYKECLELKEKMDSNEELSKLIKKIKILQKNLLRNPSIELEQELKLLEKKLNDIPIYVMYNQKLSIINEKISYINDEINEYFYKMLNEE